MSGEFVERHRLAATSSVRSALKVLLDKDLVYRTETGYVVYDRLFGEWLRGCNVIFMQRQSPFSLRCDLLTPAPPAPSRPSNPAASVGATVLAL